MTEQTIAQQPTSDHHAQQMPVARWWDLLRTKEILALLAFAVLVQASMLFIGYLTVATRDVGNVNSAALQLSYLPEFINNFRYGDPSWYIGIAEHGYEIRPFSTDRMANWAFYPLFPLALRVFHLFVPNIVLAAMLMNTIFFLLAVVALYQLLRMDYDSETSVLAVMLLASFPAAYFLWRPGPEALFLLLSILAFYAARKHNWILAGIVGGLAAITRLQGVLLLLPLFYIYYRQYRDQARHNLYVLALLLIPAALLLHMAYLYSITVNFFANLDILQAWGNQSRWPFLTVVDYFRSPLLISYYGWDLAVLSVPAMMLATGLLILAAVKRAIRFEYLILFALSLFLIVSRDNSNAVLRYMVPLFPLFLALAVLLRQHRMLQHATLYGFAVLQAFYFMSFVQRYSWAAT